MSSNRTIESSELHLLSNKLKTRLQSINDIDARRKEYCRILCEWCVKYGIRDTKRFMTYSFINNPQNYISQNHHKITYFFENNPQIYCDNHGYTYLHGACLAGNERAVNALLIQEGVDVNIDTYTRSLLYIACQHRRENCVKILLEHGADPNKGDREQRSTPLHALALPCLCDCICLSDYCFNFCDYKRPVDEIVKMLIDKGAQIEALDLHGNTPLQSAVSRFDVELTRALLKYGASLSNLNEDKMFSANFTSIEMKCYPLSFNMIEVMQFLQSAG
ncbi:hypothetical protein TKK_0013039 [Trichogramma kaykai]